MQKARTTQLVEQLKLEEQDFEFYPTTTEMIESIITHFKMNFERYRSFDVLDIGAGDGRVLDAFSKLERINHTFAIEKSQVLLDRLSFDHSILGTNFHETDLTHQEVDLIFCNPPYSEYAEWATNIIRTAYARVIYLVIPQRWRENAMIQAAITFRDAKAEVIYSGDFLSADRQARATIDIVCVKIGSYLAECDPIEKLYSEMFGNIGLSIEHIEESTKFKQKELEGLGVMLREQQAGFSLESVIERYQAEYSELQDNYRNLSKVDPILMAELGINLKTICESLKKRIANLKRGYWNMLFNAYEPIYRNCTRQTLDKVKGQLPRGLDFTLGNIYAVTSLVLRFAKHHQESQLIDWFMRLSDPECIKNYKSNQRVFSQDRWRFNQDKHTHYKLDYRIITRTFADLNPYSSWGNDALNGQLHDILVIAGTLKLNTLNTRSEFKTTEALFNYGERYAIQYHDDKQCLQTLAEIKVFKNGNAHLFLSQEFCLRLNVEVGRLLGWLKTKEQAAEELDYPLEEVEKAFGITNLAIGYNVGNLLPSLRAGI